MIMIITNDRLSFVIYLYLYIYNSTSVQTNESLMKRFYGIDVAS